MATKKKSGKRAVKSATSKAKARPAPKPKTKAKAAPKAAKAAKVVKTFKARHQPESLRLRGASPGFTVNDLEKSIAFYRDVLGFVEKERWMRDGKLMGIDLVAGETHFMLGQDDWQKGRDRVKGVGFRVYCTTAQDVDALARDIKARGGKLDQEPTSHDWGRDIAVTDPDGFKITFMNEKK